MNKNISNSFNDSEYQMDTFIAPIRVDDSVTSLYKDQMGENIVEERIIKDLNEKIFEIFEKSRYFSKYSKVRRVDKKDIVEMYYYFKGILLKYYTFSHVEMFIGYAEFFQINYDSLYNEIGVKDRELILRELNNILGIKKKIKTKRLF